MDTVKFSHAYAVSNSLIRKFEDATSVTAAKEHVDKDLPSNGSLDIDPLARQLSDAARRSDERSRNLDRKALADLAKQILERVSGNSFSFNKSLHDMFIPQTDDARLLKRAEQATAFTNGRGENPFLKLSRDDLSLIVFDENGGFTTNERHAAWLEMNKRDCEWTMYIGKKISAEIQATGSNQSSAEVLEYYRRLPIIELAHMPGNIEFNLLIRPSITQADLPEYLSSLMDILSGKWAGSDTSAMENFQAVSVSGT
ncbi:hypothetical protein [Pseudomonas promysalinigenes]|uniref:hypothetical protein n=1 Tax=Pseudomonas promysalinigenes TaxID=485898 RepID=UPI003F9FEEE5